MQLLQLFFLIFFWLSLVRFWKTENTKFFLLAFFFLCMGIV